MGCRAWRLGAGGHALISHGQPLPQGLQGLHAHGHAAPFAAFAQDMGHGLGGIDVTCTDRDAVLAGARARGCYVNDEQVALVGLRINLR